MNDSSAFNFSQDLTQICDSFFKSTKINFFSINRLYADGGVNGIMTNPEWKDVYLKKHYNNSFDQWLNYTAHEIEDFSLWSLSNLYILDQNMINLYDDCCKHDFKNGIIFVEKFDGYHEIYNFCSNNYEADKFFIHNIDTLRLLILSIKEKINISKKMSSELDHAYVLSSSEANINSFNHQKTSPLDIKINKFYLKGLENQRYLTKREMLCLHLLTQERTTKQIAKALSVSPRTVETHLNNIKLKSNCNDLRDVKAKFLNNLYLSSCGKNRCQTQQ